MSYCRSKDELEPEHNLSKVEASYLHVVASLRIKDLSFAKIILEQEAPANIALTEKAPSEGLRITLTSDSPTRLLLSQTPDGPGSPSITVIVRPGLSHSPDFYVYGLSKTGSTTYTARAPGFSTSIATVTLAPSGILIKGPSTFGSPLLTTTGASPSNIAVCAALLGPAGEYVDVQAVAGGRSVNVKVTSSNPLVGGFPLRFQMQRFPESKERL